MKVLVTGGAGYIGRHVCLALAGHDVTVLDNLETGFHEGRNNIQDADIRDAAEVSDIIRKGDFKCIIHLAGIKSIQNSMNNPALYSDVNINGTINVLSAAITYGVPSFVFASTSCVYGASENPHDEDSLIDPPNYYGFTKYNIEQILRWYASLGKVNYAALRFFVASGFDGTARVRYPERNPSNLLPTIMEVLTGKREHLRVFGDAEKIVRDYVHVSDIADAVRLSVDYLSINRFHNLILNVGTGEGTSLAQLVNTVEFVTGKDVPRVNVARVNGIPDVIISDPFRARLVLNWSPKYSNLENIIETMWNTYKNQ